MRNYYYLEMSNYKWVVDLLNLPGRYIRVEAGRLSAPIALIEYANRAWYEQVDDQGNETIECIKSRNAHISKNLTDQDMHEFNLAKLRSHNVRLQTRR